MILWEGWSGCSWIWSLLQLLQDPVSYPDNALMLCLQRFVAIALLHLLVFSLKTASNRRKWEFLMMEEDLSSAFSFSFPISSDKSKPRFLEIAYFFTYHLFFFLFLPASILEAETQHCCLFPIKVVFIDFLSFHIYLWCPKYKL